LKGDFRKIELGVLCVIDNKSASSPIWLLLDEVDFSKLRLTFFGLCGSLHTTVKNMIRSLGMP